MATKSRARSNPKPKSAKSVKTKAKMNPQSSTKPKSKLNPQTSVTRKEVELALELNTVRLLAEALWCGIHLSHKNTSHETETAIEALCAHVGQRLMLRARTREKLEETINAANSMMRRRTRDA